MDEDATPITVLARWQVAEPHVAEVMTLLTTMRQQSLAEPGCLGYEVFRSPDDAGELLLVERYRDSGAIEEHRHSLHYRVIVSGHIVPLLKTRQVELLRQ